MAEFVQTYGIWIVLAGAMLLMHRLGIGCCGGHRHGPDDASKGEPKPTNTKAVAGEKPEAVAATPPPRGGSCH